jgi:hypothetical protein
MHADNKQHPLFHGLDSDFVVDIIAFLGFEGKLSYFHVIIVLILACSKQIRNFPLITFSHIFV